MPMTVAPARSRLADSLAVVVFTVGEASYLWADVVLAGMRWGDWAELEEQAALGLACRRRAEAEELVLDRGEVARAAAEFRYARGLVTAEEMGVWLARWGLDADDWMAWVEQSILRRRWADDLAAIAARHPGAQADAAAAVWTEAVCSAALERLASRLAGRASVAAIGTPHAADDGRTAPGAAPDRNPDGLAAEVAQQGLGALAPADCEWRLARLARLERACRAFRARTVTTAALDATIGTRQLDWIRLRLRRAAFASEPAAREALLCVREDGEALDAVAGAAGAAVEETSALLEELAPDLRQWLLGASPRELLGPLRAGSAFTLIEVIDKTPPTAEDPEVRRRAEAVVIERAAEREIERHVTWRIAR
jgi:hypothetical protein